ncbi:hypothetical protein [uncultured Bradyrhizobium sp.]|uniref:hypothetical protein n=1 Tax=uncultured Bradyrhizobium sp. TaxID=199684 RepID=UPI0035CB5E6B
MAYVFGWQHPVGNSRNNRASNYMLQRTTWQEAFKVEHSDNERIDCEHHTYRSQAANEAQVQPAWHIYTLGAGLLGTPSAALSFNHYRSENGAH